MDADEFNFFDFVVNEEDEAMLLLYARDDEPQAPRIELDIDNRAAVLYRRHGSLTTEATSLNRLPANRQCT